MKAALFLFATSAMADPVILAAAEPSTDWTGLGVLFLICLAIAGLVLLVKHYPTTVKSLAATVASLKASLENMTGAHADLTVAHGQLVEKHAELVEAHSAIVKQAPPPEPATTPRKLV